MGGDYQGLGIVRSLGRRQIPVCVIDDETSISRFSRYTTHSVVVPSLREEQEAVDAVLAIGQRLGLEGWVLYPNAGRDRRSFRTTSVDVGRTVSSTDC